MAFALAQAAHPLDGRQPNGTRGPASESAGGLARCRQDRLERRGHAKRHRRALAAGPSAGPRRGIHHAMQRTREQAPGDARLDWTANQRVIRLIALCPATDARSEPLGVDRAVLVDVKGDLLATAVGRRADPVTAVLVQAGNVRVALLLEELCDLVLIQRSRPDVALLDLLTAEHGAAAEERHKTDQGKIPH